MSSRRRPRRASERSWALRLAEVTGAREAELVALAWTDLEGDVSKVGRQRHGVGELILREHTTTGKRRQGPSIPARSRRSRRSTPRPTRSPALRPSGCWRARRRDPPVP